MIATDQTRQIEALRNLARKSAAHFAQQRCKLCIRQIKPCHVRMRLEGPDGMHPHDGSITGRRLEDSACFKAAVAVAMVAQEEEAVEVQEVSYEDSANSDESPSVHTYLNSSIQLFFFAIWRWWLRR